MTDKILKYTNITTLLTLGFLLIASLISPVHLNKNIIHFFNLLIIVAGILFVISSKMLKHENKTDTPLDGLLFLIFSWYIVTTIISYNFYTSYNTAVSIFALIMVYYIIHGLSKKYFNHIVVFLLVISALLSIYGLYQYFIGFDITLAKISTGTFEHVEDIRLRLESKRIYSAFRYPNAFAGFLIMMLPVAIGFFKTEKKLRIASGAIVLLLTAALILTKSIGAFASIIIAIFIVILFITDSSLKNVKRMFFWTFFILLLAGVYVVYARGFETILSNLHGKLESYTALLSVLSKELIKGYGPGTFAQIYNASGDFSYLEHAHNGIFQSAIETGLIGAFLFLLLIFRGFKSIINNFSFIRTSQTKTTVIAFSTGISAFLIHNLIDFGIYNYEIALLFVILSAMLMSQIKIGLLELKKIKLSFLLGINPHTRRNMIFYIICTILTLGIITGGKHPYVFSLIGIMAVIGFGIWSVSKEDYRNTDLEIPLLIALFISMLSLAYTPHLYRGVQYFMLIFLAILVFYLSSQFLRRYDFRIIITNYIIFLGTVLSLAGIVQFIVAIFLKNTPIADGFFPNQNLYAGYIVIPFAIILSKLLLEKKISRLWLKITLLALFISAEALSRSKGGMLSMLVVFVLIWIYYNYYKAQVKDTPQRILFKSRLLKIMVTIFIVGAFTGITPSGEKIINVKNDPFYFNRASIYKSTIKIALDKPILGYGLGSFQRIFPKYNFPIKESARYQMEARFAHNEMLETAANLGIPGLILFIFILFNIMKNIPSYDGHKKTWASSTGAYFALAGVIIHSFVDFNLHLPGTLLTSAVLASIVTKENFSLRTVSKESLLFTKTYYFPPLILTVLLLTIFLRPGVSKILMDRYEFTQNYGNLKNAHVLEYTNSDILFKMGLEFEKEKKYLTSSELYIQLLETDKYNYITQLHLARMSARLRKSKAALNYFAMAIDSNPYRAFSYFELADYYRNNLYNNDMAKVAYKKATELEPNYAQARFKLALLYIKENNYKDALAELDAIESILSDEFPTTEYEKDLLKFRYTTMLYLNKAHILKEMKLYQDSCYYYKKALQLYDNKNAREIMTSLCETEKISDCCE